MPVKKFKDPLLKPKEPSTKLSIGSTSLIPKAIGSERVPQKVYPNGNKGWDNLKKHHENQRERLKGNWNTLSSSIMNWLLEENEAGVQYRLIALLEESKLKDIGVMLGISTEKVLLLEGQPTQIIGQQAQAKLDEIGPALMDALNKRGIVTLTERKAEIKLEAKPDDGSSAAKSEPPAKVKVVK